MTPGTYLPHQLGRQAERQALNYLRTQGLRLLERNFRSRSGEIDLIMTEHDCLVFVEVRYRNRSDYGGALASIDSRKQRRIIRCAEYFLQRHPQRLQYPIRFDVVCVQFNRQQAQCEWIKAAFDTA